MFENIRKKNKKNFNIHEGKNILTTKKQESKILLEYIFENRKTIRYLNSNLL